MLFSSMIFIWIFLPMVIIVNFLLSVMPFREELVRMKAKNFFLLIASLCFYSWGGGYYLLIMLVSILVNYLGGLIIGREEKGRYRKLELSIIIVINLGILVVFKYFNMIVVIIEAVMEADGDMVYLFHNMLGMAGTGKLSIPQIALPIGISFFTFQAMSYVIDVYRKKTDTQKNLLDFTLYVSFFPQLVAGPIVKYSDIAQQLQQRQESIVLFASGQKRFCYGLGKKVLFANTFAEVADGIWALDIARIGCCTAWLGIAAYTLQIYYDFSGYSDMAIGIGRMLGFRFKENFNYPYTSLSVQEFWRRWHISLSSWFKEYVYIPMGGSRSGMKRTCWNLFIVFLLTGIWHGANFTFILWGVFYGIILIGERLFLGKILDGNIVKIVNWLYCTLCVMVGWVLFRSDTIFQAAGYLGRMFGGGEGDYPMLSFLSMKVMLAFLLGIPLAGFGQQLFGRIYETVKFHLPVMVCELCIQAGVVILSVLMLVSGTYNPFIYFQF